MIHCFQLFLNLILLGSFRGFMKQNLIYALLMVIVHCSAMEQLEHDFDKVSLTDNNNSELQQELHNAIEYGDLTLVKQLVNNKRVDVNLFQPFTDSHEVTALGRAIFVYEENQENLDKLDERCDIIKFLADQSSSDVIKKNRSFRYRALYHILQILQSRCFDGNATHFLQVVTHIVDNPALTNEETVNRGIEFFSRLKGIFLKAPGITDERDLVQSVFEDSYYNRLNVDKQIACRIFYKVAPQYFLPLLDDVDVTVWLQVCNLIPELENDLIAIDPSIDMQDSETVLLNPEATTLIEKKIKAAAQQITLHGSNMHALRKLHEKKKNCIRSSKIFGHDGATPQELLKFFKQ